jgi:UDP-glucose 4-epimerase
VKLLITGASGFIGRNLAESLQGDHEVESPGRTELDLLDDAAVRNYLAGHRFDCVIHSATGRSDRQSTAPNLLKNNCRMFFNLARNSNLFGKLLSLGSGAEYGVRVPRMSEALFDTYVPSDDYAFSKYVAAQLIEHDRTNLYNLRLFGVFGKYERYQVRFISNAICRVLCNMPIVLRQNARFDYLYIGDLVTLIRWFLANEPRHHVYNVCRGESQELLALAQIVAKTSGRNPQVQVSQPGLAPEYSGDNARLLQEVSGVSFTPIEQAVHELFRWYEEHLDSIDRDALSFDG